jgi:hypothetical protein
MDELCAVALVLVKKMVLHPRLPELFVLADSV